MNGLEISKKFYMEYGASMIKEQFPDIEKDLAIALIGSGSECFGFDDDISTDHDFDPGFQIFIKDDIDNNLKFRLERAYSRLPMEYMGFKRAIMSPVGGNRRGVKRISEFLKEKIGREDGKLDSYDWISIPEYTLSELVNGEIFRDDTKFLTNIRFKFATYPTDIKLKKLAAEILIMAQSGQYNFKRCIEHKEIGAARLALYEFVNATIHATFLLKEVYMPYYKWKFKAMRNLSWPFSINLEEKLYYLLSISDDTLLKEDLIGYIDGIAKIFIDRIKAEGFSNRSESYLEKYAYDINNKIKDIDMRNMNILAAI